VCLVSLKKGIEGLGVPSKTYGYFAYGKPVISVMSDKTEIATNIITYEAGFNVIQNDVDGFITSIERLMANRDLVEDFGKNSFRLHNDFYEKSKSLNKYIRMVDELIR
jgi:glycosyltransferase involved in cell wall biosynthesis